MTQVDMHEAVVAVFGDLGRSPRMVNHARELLKQNFRVHIIGYRGGTLGYSSLGLSSVILSMF